MEWEGNGPISQEFRKLGVQGLVIAGCGRGGGFLV